MVKNDDYVKELLNFIDATPNIFFAVKNISETLLDNGYKQLDYKKEWALENGGKYFVNKNDKAIVAFSIGNGNLMDDGFRIIGTHGDSPCFKVKPNHIMTSNNYVKLSTECYGGPIISTWLDRHLAISGKIIVKNNNNFPFDEILINIDKPLFVIPNLAVHINRGMNDGYKYNNQIDMQAVLGIINEDLENDDRLLNIIEEETGVAKEDILDFELYLYIQEKAELIGYDNSLISAPRLDNLWMTYTGLKGLLESTEDKATKVFVCFDSEEVGSVTSEGANSFLLRNILKRISLSLNKNDEQFLIALDNSIFVSADLAHAVHPNLSDKMDPINAPVLGKGPVIKYAANQSYATSAYSASIFKHACEKANVPYQVYTNKSDTPGGSTIGPMTSSILGTHVVDVGGAVLSMHSAKEVGEKNDNLHMIKAMKSFYDI